VALVRWRISKPAVRLTMPLIAVCCIAPRIGFAQDDVGSIAGTVRAPGLNYANVLICAQPTMARTPRCTTAQPPGGFFSWCSKDAFPFRLSQFGKGQYELTVAAPPLQPYPGFNIDYRAWGGGRRFPRSRLSRARGGGFCDRVWKTPRNGPRG